MTSKAFLYGNVKYLGITIGFNFMTKFHATKAKHNFMRRKKTNLYLILKC